MSAVDLYDVLGLNENATKKEIQLAYGKLVKKYHPDKRTGSKEMFELITHAYNILINDKSRSDYDNIFDANKNTDSHISLKTQSREYFETINKKSEKISDPQREAQLSKVKKDFEKQNQELNNKHGVNSCNFNPIPIHDAIQRLEDLALVREQDDIETSHEKLFDDGEMWNPAKFNYAFDIMNKGHNELVPHNGNPYAYNVLDNMATSQFSTIENYDKLYGEDDDAIIQGTMYSSVKLESSKATNSSKLSKRDIKTLSEAEYTQHHNKLSADYNKSIDELLAQRKLETDKLDGLAHGEFDTSADCGGYGIFKDLGINITPQLNFDGFLPDIDDDLVKTYNKLLESRRG